MAYRVEGSYFENCSCDSVCPCNTSGLMQPADHDYCHFLIAFHIDRGAIDGVDIADRSVVIVGEAPGDMTQGNWAVGMVIDDGASDEQAAALQGFFTGATPGPFAALSPLFGEVLGIERLPIDYADDGLKHRVSVAGGAAAVEIEDLVQAGQSEPVTLGNVSLPWGPTILVSRVESAQIRLFGRDWDLTGLNGNSAPIAWSG